MDKLSVFRSDPIIPKGRVTQVFTAGSAHSVIIEPVDCLPSIRNVHKGAPETTVKADPGWVFGVLVGFLFCFVFYVLVSLDRVVQGIFKPVMLLPQLP